MATKKKICTALVVDVSPSMHAHLGHVGDHLSRVVQNRILNAKIDEFALIACGSDDTNNDVHTEGLEAAAASGERDYEEEYRNIAVKVPMGCSSSESAEVVASLRGMAGSAPCDYLEALVVASDMLVNHQRGGAFLRRIMLVTDLRTPCETDDDFIGDIARGMRAVDMQLTVAVVRCEESEDATTRAQEEETVMANKETLRRLCDLLNEGAVTVANRSCIEDHAVALQAAQVKTTKPTTTFRGDLEFTPWMSLKVWVYKKVSEAKPPSMKMYSDAADETAGDDPTVGRERVFRSYADPDAPVDVAPEMMISAYPYGPANIPIQDEVKELIAARNDKGMKIFGFTSLDQVPHWMGMDEPRVLVPWPTKDGSLAAGMAASAGATDREHRKATEAMSAMARAMQRKGQAALVRAVWTQNSDKVSFGALTPHITKEGDFLLFVPLPFAEDMYSNDFKPLPVPGSKAAEQLNANAKAKLVPTDEQRAAAAALVDALDGSGPDPWECLNPSLTRTHALLAARAANELAAPLAPAAGSGPDAAAALLASPFTGVPAMALPACRSRAGPGASEAAAAFKSACGGLKLTEPKTGWKRKRGGTEALPARDEDPEEDVPAGGDDDAAAVPEAAARKPRREDGGAAPAETASAPPQRTEPPRGDEDAWTVVIKEEPVTQQVVMDAPTQVIPEEEEPANMAVPTQLEAPKPADDDEFFDDME